MDEVLSERHFFCILALSEKNFILLYPRKTWWENANKVHYFDALSGEQICTKLQFYNKLNEQNAEGNPQPILFLEPSIRQFLDKQGNPQTSWRTVFKYFSFNRWQTAQVLITLIIAVSIQFVFPFLMQSVVDIGIISSNLHFVAVILIAQLSLTFFRTTIDFIRDYLLQQISNMVSISMLSDFWIKIMKLPVEYFEKNSAGDLIQRIQDNKQLHGFVTGPAFRILLETLNFTVFAIVFIVYRFELFLTFLVGALVYLAWMALFFKARRKVNEDIFVASSVEKDAALQIVNGISEIKLQNIENVKRWEWERAQLRVFKFNFKGLLLNQFQQGGVHVIRTGTDILLTFLVAKLVIDGELTLGAMLAIQYVIANLNTPVQFIVGFLQLTQDAKISMERINKIQQLKEEQPEGQNYATSIPNNKSIVLSNVSFSYPGSKHQVLKNINLEIPHGKTVAVVGVSGSGKTTLLKLLLRFYEDYQGDITIDATRLKDIKPAMWRSKCSAVLQDGFLFNDSIVGNITLHLDRIEPSRLDKVCEITNIKDLISELPEGYYTRIAAGGNGLSSGQIQRLLIARAMYKDSDFMFFDEATNALDATNEKVIMKNMEKMLIGKTVVVVAHRLSTVMNADKIVVLERGTIVEEGSHQTLVDLKGRYYELVRNQLELGR